MYKVVLLSGVRLSLMNIAHREQDARICVILARICVIFTFGHGLTIHHSLNITMVTLEVVLDL